MKYKIKEFAKGNFQRNIPNITCSTSNIIMKIGEGEQYEDSFQIRNTKEGSIRGLVYPSSVRIHCREQGFESNIVTVKFVYDSSGLMPGYVEQGTFTVVCNGGEFEIAYSVIIERPFVDTAFGRIQSLADFKKLAYTDYGTAWKLFRSREFATILKYEPKRISSLYDHMRTWSLSEQALEEFLVGTSQKEKIFLTLETHEKRYEELEENLESEISVTKNTWGFLSIRIKTEGAFLSTELESITTDDFLGSRFSCKYKIEKEQLHNGRNFGKLIIESIYETLTYEIEVVQSRNKNTNFRDQDLACGFLLRSYLVCEGGATSINEWTKQAAHDINLIRDEDPNNQYFKLLQAHIYIKGEQFEEARWLLEEYPYNRFAVGKQNDLESYYLFLSALLNNDTSYNKRIAEDIEKQYIKKPRSWYLLCMLLYLDKKYQNPTERLHVLERQFYNGARQIICYLEAYRCYKSDVRLLKRFGSFEIQVLNFASKYNLLTKEITLCVANLASQQKKFNLHIYHILERGYANFEEPMVLTSICTLLIKGNHLENKYFTWYSKAVEKELKIARLYEYYMSTITPNEASEVLPKSVYLYFSHGNILNEEKKALLYSTLIVNEELLPEIFSKYKEEIKTFAFEQLEKYQINDQLRIIYRRFLKEDNMNSKRIRALYSICHTYKITSDRKQMKYVLVIDKEGDITQKVPFTNGEAIVVIFDKKDRIIWEDKEGIHYTSSIPYETKRLFFEVRFMQMCKEHLQNMERTQEKKVQLTFEELRLKGIEMVDARIARDLCSEYIREENYLEDSFVLYACFQLFLKEEYNKTILTYLSMFYCGATKNMKKIWEAAVRSHVDTHKLAERIITQELYSETMFQSEHIFLEYYKGGSYHRLKDAYLAYISREFVVRNRTVDSVIFEIVLSEYERGESILDICRIASLKYYAGKKIEKEMYAMLYEFMHTLCAKDIYFSFFLLYEQSWLRKLQLWDKTIIEYFAEKDSEVNMRYKIEQEEKEMFTQNITALHPMYECIYAKKIILFSNEVLEAIITENHQSGEVTRQESTIYGKKDIIAGKLGKLNAIMESNGEEKNNKISEYQIEEMLAKDIFRVN